MLWGRGGGGHVQYDIELGNSSQRTNIIHSLKGSYMNDDKKQQLEMCPPSSELRLTC